MYTHTHTHTHTHMGFPSSSASKESICNAGDPVSIPGLGMSPGEGIDYSLQYSWASLVDQMVKNLPAMWETWVGKILCRRAWQPTPVFLPGESPWTEEPGGLQPMGSQSWTWLSTHLWIYLHQYISMWSHYSPMKWSTLGDACGIFLKFWFKSLLNYWKNLKLLLPWWLRW